MGKSTIRKFVSNESGSITIQHGAMIATLVLGVGVGANEFRDSLADGVDGSSSAIEDVTNTVQVDAITQRIEASGFNIPPNVKSKLKAATIDPTKALDQQVAFIPPEEVSVGENTVSASDPERELSEKEVWRPNTEVGEWRGVGGNTGRTGIEYGRESTYVRGGDRDNMIFELDYNRGRDQLEHDFDTLAGWPYIISFDSTRRGNSSPETNTFDVFYGDEHIARIVPGTSWERYSFEVEGTGEQITLKFQEPPGPSDSYGALLDDISFEAAQFLADGSIDYSLTSAAETITIAHGERTGEEVTRNDPLPTEGDV